MDSFKIAEIKRDTLKEGQISKQLRSVISKWAAFAAEHYKEWDKRPECGHFFGGVYNYGIETSATSVAVAVLATIGEYDEDTIGVSKERLIEMTTGAIRYLCFTHHTGPKDCVREKGRNPSTSGKKWGYTKDSFFMTSQTGVSVSMLGLASWLLWEHLNDETRGMVSRILEFYADRFSEMEPGTGVYNDTQCEENAWTSLGIAAALYMFPDHPRNEIWRDGYINWSLNSVTTFKDKLNNEKDKVTKTHRGGFVHKGKSYGVSSVTFHPDFTTENHGYVHPDYMGGGIILRVSSSVFPLLAGEEPLGSLFYNFSDLYERVLKPWCAPDGNPIPVQGQDWFYHRHQNKLIIHAAMNLFFSDSDAAMFEQKCMDIIIRRQDSTEKGCLMEKNGEKLEVTPGLQSALDMEYGAIRTIVLSYLMHLLKGDGVKPEDTGKIMKKLSGNHMYPYGGVYIHRTPDSFSSFTTRCSVMGLSIPANGMWDITTDFQGFTGIIREKNKDDEYFRKKKINWKDIGIETLREKIEEYDSGFSITAEIPRANGAIHQKSSFSALPDGKVVYAEKITAVRQIDTEVFETGKISIGNENFKYLPEYAKGYKDVYFNGKSIRFNGNYDGDDIRREFKDIRHVNVDDRIGYLLFGNSGTEYINRHRYPKWKGLEDIMILNKKKPAVYEKGDKTGVFAMVTLPNAKSTDMEKEYESACVTVSNDDIFIMRINGYRVSVNFNDKKAKIEERLNVTKTGLEIFSGRTLVKSNSAKCVYSIKGFSSSVNKSAGKIIFSDSPDGIDIMCSDDGIWISNESGRTVNYTFRSEAPDRIIMHLPGTVRNIRN